MTLVWRVEDKRTGEGPYIRSRITTQRMPSRVWFDLGEMADRHSFDMIDGVTMHPSPEEEAGLNHMILDSEVCGFLKASDLRSWFECWATVLDNAGYEVVVYDVPDFKIRVGKFQIVFDKGDLRPLESFKTTTIIGG